MEKTTITQDKLHKDFDEMLRQFALLYREIKEDLHTGLSVTNEIEELIFQMNEIDHFNKYHWLYREIDVEYCRTFLFNLAPELEHTRAYRGKVRDKVAA